MGELTFSAGNLAGQGAIVRPKPELADFLPGHELVDVGLPNPEELGVFLLGIPPAVVAADDVLFNDGRYVGHHLACAPGVFDLYPIALMDSVLFCGNGIDFNRCVPTDFA